MTPAQRLHTEVPERIGFVEDIVNGCHGNIPGARWMLHILRLTGGSSYLSSLEIRRLFTIAKAIK